MKTLIWKELREQRLWLLTGSILLIIFSIILPIIFKTYDTFTITAFAVVIISGMIGADSFSREKSTLEFLLSNPLKKETVFYAKLLSDR